MKLITQQGVTVDIKPETIHILYREGGGRSVVIAAESVKGNAISLGQFPREEDAEKVMRKIAVLKKVPNYD